MKNLQNFNEFNENSINESWRQTKAWLRVPQMLIDILLSKLLNYIPRLNFIYDKHAAKVDTGLSLNRNEISDEPIKLTIDGIKNEKIKKSVKLSGLLKEWNIYTFDRTHEDRQPIYITKDELKKGDYISGERLSDFEVDKNYSNKKIRRYFKSKGVNKLSELEPQFWVVCAKITEKHDKMDDERKERSNIKKKKALEKLVKDSIKEGDFTGRTKQIYYHWNNNPLVYKIIDADRVDLMKELIDACEELDGIEEVKRMLTQAIDNEGWSRDYYKYGSFNDIKTPLKEAKSDEMKNLIKKYIGQDAKY